MLSEALAFPRADEDWLKTVLIGGVLSLLGFLVIPVILVNGYLLRVMRAAVDGRETTPRFGDWGELFVDGLLLWVIQLVYMGIPTFVLVIAFTFIVAAGVAAGTATDQPALLLGAGIVGAIPLLGLFLIVLLAGYLLPAALANYARTDDVAAAFHLRTVAGAAFSVDYFVAVVLAIVVSIVLGIIGGLLTIVLVGIFVIFYMQMVVYHLFGQGFASGFAADPTRGESADAAG